MAEDHSEPASPEPRPHGVRAANVLLILVFLVITFYVLRRRQDAPVDIASTRPADLISEVERFGGTIDRSDPMRVAVAFDTATDADLPHIAKIQNVTSLDLSGSEVTDHGLRKLGELPGLEVLKLDNTGVTDSGLQHLRALDKLGHLNLTGTSITGTGLAHLAELANLRFLFLSETSVVDEDLAHLAGLPQLEMLFLNGLENASLSLERRMGLVTDRGLEHLYHLENLILLDLRNTAVTETGVAELRKVLPRCNIRF